jgi:hypothetical protein
MKTHAMAPLAVVFMLVLPQTGQAQLSAYSQNFETLAPAEPAPGSNSALADDGWLVYANVFAANGSFIQGYGAATPNGLLAFSGVGTAGSQPGNQNMAVYSDYNNSVAHQSGQWVEANVYQERIIAAGDVGTAWTFQFDARLFNLLAPSTAQAFVKTLDPANGYQITGWKSVDMSAVPDAWGTYSLSFTVTAAAGQVLQFGFSNTATNYNGSAILYDNISLSPVPEPAALVLMLAGLGLMGVTARRR